MPEPSTGSRRILRAIVLVLGILLPQCLLYGPSLFGDRVPLPLDLLQQPGIYEPVNPAPPASSAIRSDLVLAIELRRQFAVQEVRAGRLPLWNPHAYCGAPFVAANNTAVFSPFRVPQYLFPGVGVLAWVILLRALVGGVGTYLFLRRSLHLGFAAAALGAWSVPLTGFQVIWTGYPPSHAAVWLPWLLFGVERCLRRPAGWGPLILGGATAASLMSGHAATGAQGMVASGIFGLALLARRGGFSWFGVAALAGGWLLGIALSALQTLPTVEYLATSARVASRASGVEETPAQGWSAVLQLLLPGCYGHDRNGWAYLLQGNRLEHAATGYGGLLWALLLAPLAWRRRRQRVPAWILTGLGVFGLGAALGLPVLAQLFELPPFSLLRNNRLVFVCGFAAVALGAMGLDTLIRRGHLLRWRHGYALPVLALAALGTWSLLRGLDLPEPLRAASEDDPGLRSTFVRRFLFDGLLCAGGMLGWLLLVRRPRNLPLAFMLGAACLLEMLGNAWSVVPQIDRTEHYRRIPVLEQVADAEPPGRAQGFLCLPPNLMQSHGLRDLRGYDGADPGAVARLLEAAHDPRAPASPPHARTFWFTPVPEHPIPRMLGLRYVVFRGDPPPGFTPRFAQDGYYVMEWDALPRPFVPERVESVDDPEQQFERILAPEFDPAAVAYVAGSPAIEGPVRGSARIVREEPCHITIDCAMERDGLVVLPDLWYPGWEAEVDGDPVEVLRSNYLLRGVRVPAGAHRLEFVYRPGSFRLGLWISGVAALIAAALLLRLLRHPGTDPGSR